MYLRIIFHFAFYILIALILNQVNDKGFKLACMELEFKLVMEGDDCIIQSYTIYNGKSELEPLNSYKSIDELVKSAFSLFANSARDSKKWWVTNKDLFDNQITLKSLISQRKIFKKTARTEHAIESVKGPALAKIAVLTGALDASKDPSEQERLKEIISKERSQLALRISAIENVSDDNTFMKICHEIEHGSKLNLSLLDLTEEEHTQLACRIAKEVERIKKIKLEEEEKAAKERAAKEKEIKEREAKEREIKEKVAQKRAAKEKKAKENSDKILNAVLQNDTEQFKNFYKMIPNLGRIKTLEGESLFKIALKNKNIEMSVLLVIEGVSSASDFEFNGISGEIYIQTYKTLQSYLSKLNKVPAKHQKREGQNVVQFLNPKKNSETLKRKLKDKTQDTITLTNSILSFSLGFESQIYNKLIARLEKGDSITNEVIDDCLLQVSIEFKEALAKKAEEASNKADALKMARQILDEVFKKNLEDCSTKLEILNKDMKRKETIKEQASKIVQSQENFQASLQKFSSVLPQFARKIDKVERVLKDAIKKSERSEKLPEELATFIKDFTAKQVEVASHGETFSHAKIEEYERISTELLTEFEEKCRLFSNSVDDLSALALECKSFIRELLEEIKDYDAKEKEQQRKRAKTEIEQEFASSGGAGQEIPAKLDHSKKDDKWHGGKAARREHFEAEQRQAKEEKEARDRKEAEDRRREEQGGKSQKSLHYSFKQGAGKAPEAATLDIKGQISGKVFYAENLKTLESILKSAIFKPNSEKNHARFKAERHALLGAFGQMVEILKVLYNKNTPMIEAFNHIRNVIFHCSNIFAPIEKTSSLKEVQKTNERIIEMAINTLAFLNDLKNGLVAVPKDKDALLMKINSKLLYTMDCDEIDAIDTDDCLKQIELGAKDLGDYCEIESEQISEMLDMARGFSVTQIGTYATEIKKIDFKYYNDSLRNKSFLDRYIEWFIEQGKDFRHIRKMDLGGRAEAKKHHAAKSESAKSETSKNGKQKGKQQVKKRAFS